MRDYFNDVYLMNVETSIKPTKSTIVCNAGSAIQFIDLQLAQIYLQKKPENL